MPDGYHDYQPAVATFSTSVRPSGSSEARGSPADWS